MPLPASSSAAPAHFGRISHSSAHSLVAFWGCSPWRPWSLSEEAVPTTGYRVILLPLGGPWVGAESAGILNLLTPTGFREEVGRIPLTSLVGCQRRILWHFLELVFIAVWLALNPEATEKKSTDRTGLWIRNHTSPPLPQASMLGWTCRGFFSP